MIDYSVAAMDPARCERRSGRVKRDTTRMYVRLAQQRANRGEPIDGSGTPATAERGVRGLMRRLWPHRRGG